MGFINQRPKSFMIMALAGLLSIAAFTSTVNAQERSAGGSSGGNNSAESTQLATLASLVTAMSEHIKIINEQAIEIETTVNRLDERVSNIVACNNLEMYYGPASEYADENGCTPLKAIE